MKTKPNSEEEIVKAHLSGLRDSRAKGMIQGLELSAKMIYNYIQKGHTLDEVKKFCEKIQTSEGRTAMMKYLSVDEEIK